MSFLLTKLPSKNTSHKGFSLLECLIGIVVITIVISAISPPIFLAVGTRIQNRRAEQALQLAQGEVDRVRRTVETGNYSDTDLPPEGAAPNTSPQSQNAPGSADKLPSGKVFPTSATQAAEVDVNGDGNSDFFVQIYRTPGVRNNDSQLMAFGMGVRVYAYSAKQNFGTLETTTASLRMTTALGQQQKRPLAVIYSNVVRSDTGVSLQCYQQFLGNGIFKCN
ncbi:prepilin-type N-terminal cleavage/methylation domain-containing protein [Phormidium sp. LEGE 05292]|uniref:prepilin-type N-terminal cleavage/methylation domain-containing protein n=1 Tax=[Phormidium] sp. LEGE 05292 TaxID=767427 RepID=UPI00187F9A13|nr:prepilin-type N-terminal cleavage/methylation domain-containing protein [Phormidium sp. LEGE 05292]MBE9229330.1 prepilin-type N-terminal cleavage/methylation domain-containing protein [Phormidium sp. LEGE 05292]